MISRDARGFVVMEVLIAGLILTASIAAAMQLFRTGFAHMERVERANFLSAKLLQAGSALKIVALETLSGTEDLGDGVIMKWKSRLLAQDKPAIRGMTAAARPAVKKNDFHELFLYEVDFLLEYRKSAEEYHIRVFRSRPLSWQ